MARRTILPYLDMISVDQKVTDGISLTWGPTSGYKHGNTYSFDLVPMPTSILPVATSSDTSILIRLVWDRLFTMVPVMRQPEIVYLQWSLSLHQRSNGEKTLVHTVLP